MMVFCIPQDAFAAMFRDRPPPPASKRFIDDLPCCVLRDDLDLDCPICLKKMEQDDVVVRENAMPCGHRFHKVGLRH